MIRGRNFKRTEWVKVIVPLMSLSCIRFFLAKDQSFNFKSLTGNEFFPQSQIYFSFSLEPDVLNLWYFKLWVLLDQKV